MGNLYNILEEMVNEACEAINFEKSPENVQQVIDNVDVKTGIRITKNTTATAKLVRLVAHEVEKWQRQTEDMM